MPVTCAALQLLTWAILPLESYTVPHSQGTHIVDINTYSVGSYLLCCDALLSDGENF